MKFFRFIAPCLILLLYYSNSYCQKDAFSKDIDGMFTANQFYNKCLLLGTVDTHQQDSITKLYPNICEQVQRWYVWSDTSTTDSLRRMIEILNKNNFALIKHAMENGIIKKLDNDHASKFDALIDCFTLQQFSTIDTLLLGLVKQKIIKPMNYASAYDMVYMMHQKLQKYFVVFVPEEKTGKVCVQIPPDIQQANLYRKQIGLKKWKMECRDANNPCNSN